MQRTEAERNDVHEDDSSEEEARSCHQSSSGEELHTSQVCVSKAAGHAQEEENAARRPQRKRTREEYPGMVGEEQTTVRAARRRGHMDRAGTPGGALKYMIQTGYHMIRRIEEADGEEARPWE